MLYYLYCSIILLDPLDIPLRGQGGVLDVAGITVWKQAINPKKWRENFPAIKIALLFMA